VVEREEAICGTVEGDVWFTGVSLKDVVCGRPLEAEAEFVVDVEVDKLDGILGPKSNFLLPFKARMFGFLIKKTFLFLNAVTSLVILSASSGAFGTVVSKILIILFRLFIFLCGHLGIPFFLQIFFKTVAQIPSSLATSLIGR